MKGKDDIAHTNQASVFEKRSAFDHDLVQKRTVSAVEVFGVKTQTIADHFAVITTDRANVDHDITFGMPAKDRFRPVEFISPAGLRAVVRGEKGHPTSILGMKGGAAYVHIGHPKVCVFADSSLWVSPSSTERWDGSWCKLATHAGNSVHRRGRGVGHGINALWSALNHRNIIEGANLRLSKCGGG